MCWSMRSGESSPPQIRGQTHFVRWRPPDVTPSTAGHTAEQRAKAGFVVGLGFADAATAKSLRSFVTPAEATGVWGAGPCNAPPA